MSYKLLTTYPTTDGVAVTGTGTYYSAPMQLRESGGFGAQLVWTGTPTGTFTLWGSNRDNPNFANDVDWVQLLAASFSSQPAGSAGGIAHEHSTRFDKVRYRYVNSLGSGTIFAYGNIPRGGA